MAFVILVSALILIQYQYFAYSVGMARGKYDVQAPATTGDENFERVFRVHINTLEQLIITLPAMWICAFYLRTDIAAILGAFFLAGRFIYSAAYTGDPSKRGIGMMIGFIANILLLLCCLYAGVIRLI
jgi:uncharacterized membrane protein YecN with MAPEG domain